MWSKTPYHLNANVRTHHVWIAPAGTNSNEITGDSGTLPGLLLNKRKADGIVELETHPEVANVPSTAFNGKIVANCGCSEYAVTMMLPEPITPMSAIICCFTPARNILLIGSERTEPENTIVLDVRTSASANALTVPMLTSSGATDRPPSLRLVPAVVIIWAPAMFLLREPRITTPPEMLICGILCAFLRQIVPGQWINPCEFIFLHFWRF